MKAIHILAILLAVSISFSSLLWQVDIRGEPTTRPILFQDAFVIASADGNIYAINPRSGSYVWKTNTGVAVDIIEFGGKIIALTRDGNVSAIDKNGKIVWTVTLAKVNATLAPTSFYGLGKNSRNVFATTNAGAYKIGENTASLFYAMNNTYGKPAVDEQYVIITAENSIVKINMNEKLAWSKQLEAKLWMSTPEISGDIIYFGALDNKLHALRSDGSTLFEFGTGGWVRTSPFASSGNVYFGSDDAHVYKIYGNGELEWKATLHLAPVSKPIEGVLGDKKVIFISADGRVYAIDDSSGEVVWKTPLLGKNAGQPIFHQNKLMFASNDKYVYIYSTSRGCSIDAPVDGEVVGHKEVEVKGKSVSSTGQQQVFISINDQGWLETTSKADGSWEYYLNPQVELQEGPNVISCRVEDVGGSEEGTYTTVTFVRDSDVPFDDFIISIPNTPFENEPFDMYINSKSDGSPVERFTIIIDGAEHSGDKKIKQTLAGGSHTITVKKMGYNDKTITLNVQSREINQIYIAGGVVILLLAIWLVYAKLIKK